MRRFCKSLGLQLTVALRVMEQFDFQCLLMYFFEICMNFTLTCSLDKMFFTVLPQILLPKINVNFNQYLGQQTKFTSIF